MKRIIQLSLLLCFMSSNSHANTSQTKIVNGIDVTIETNYTKPVVKLRDENSKGYCTGTLLGDRTLLTAVHCLERSGNMEMPYLLTPSGRLVAGQKLFYDRKALAGFADIDTKSRRAGQLGQEFFQRFACDPSSFEAQTLLNELESISTEVGSVYDNVIAKYDALLVIFPPGTGSEFVGSGPYYKVKMNQPLNFGDNLKFIGFGNNYSQIVPDRNSCSGAVQDSGFGPKRMGFNNLETTSPYLTIKGFRTRGQALNYGYSNGNNVGIGRGDSGGPWIHCGYDRSCPSLNIVGISSYGEVSNKPQNEVTGVSMLTQQSREMFESAINCGEAPCADEFREY